MPTDAKILAVNEQNDNACLWAECHPNADLEQRDFRIYGTGHELPDEPGDYVGTFQQAGGKYIWHVYETTAH